MRYYAHFGYNDFVLCLGYKAEVIKEYFLDYDEALSNDFVLSDGGRSSSSCEPTSRTGGSRSSTPACMRHRRAAHGGASHLEGEEVFLANYTDVLTDARMDLLVEDF